MLSTLALTWSSSPVETPPVVRIRSWVPATSCSARASAARSSLRMPRSLTSQPSRRQHRHQHEAVGIEQLRRGARFARRDQFVAGGEHRDANAPDDVELRQAERRDQRDILRPQPLAGLERGMACGMSSPAGRTLAPGFRPAGRTTLSSSTRTSSCMKTVSAPSGIGAPVKMRIACPGLTGADRSAAGLDAPGDCERLLFLLRQVAARDRIAIDGGIGEGRQRQRRRNVVRKNAAIGAARAQPSPPPAPASRARR